MNIQKKYKDISEDEIENYFKEACQNGLIDDCEYLYKKHKYNYKINLNADGCKYLKIIEKNHKNLIKDFLDLNSHFEKRIFLGNVYIDGTTDFYFLEKENKTKELSLYVLLKKEESLEVIPEELKTPDFLLKLSREKYIHNILKYDFIYDQKYKSFLLEYIENGNQLSRKVTLTNELLDDRDFVLRISNKKSKIFRFIQEKYKNDLDVMTNIALNDEDSFEYIQSKFRDIISKNKETALELIKLNVLNYNFINYKMKFDDDCINYILQVNPSMYESIPKKVKDDDEKTLNYIKKYNIDVQFLSDKAKLNREIAYFYVNKKGNNLKEFINFKEDKELILLALNTSKLLSYLTVNLKTDEMIYKIIQEANIEDNSSNLHYIPKNIREDKKFVDLILDKELFFKEDIFRVINDYGNHKNDLEIIKKSVEKYPDFYARFFSTKENLEIINIYIESSIKQSGVFNTGVIPQKIKALASMAKMPIEKYISVKVLEDKMEIWDKEKNINQIKVKKTKI